MAAEVLRELEKCPAPWTMEGNDPVSHGTWIKGRKDVKEEGSSQLSHIPSVQFAQHPCGWSISSVCLASSITASWVRLFEEVNLFAFSLLGTKLISFQWTLIFLTGFHYYIVGYSFTNGSPSLGIFAAPLTRQKSFKNSIWKGKEKSPRIQISLLKYLQVILKYRGHWTLF